MKRYRNPPTCKNPACNNPCTYSSWGNYATYCSDECKKQNGQQGLNQGPRGKYKKREKSIKKESQASRRDFSSEELQIIDAMERDKIWASISLQDLLRQ